MRSHPAWLPLAFLLAAHAASLPAQSREPGQRVRNSPTIQTSGGFGTAVLALRDHDGDGFDDYAVAAPNAADPIGPAGPGAVYLYSGRRGTTFRRFLGDQIGARFGEVMCDPGDVNGDGVPDLVVGARDHDGGGPNAGRVLAFSGATGGVLWTRDGSGASVNLGACLCVVGDLDSDGAADLLAGEPGFGVGFAGRGRVVYLSGRTGVPLGAAEGPIAFGSVGNALASRAPAGAAYTSDALGRVYLVGAPFGGTATLTLAFDRPAGADGVAQMAFVAGPNGMRFLLGRSRVDSNGLVNNGRVQLFEGSIAVLTVEGTYGGAFVGSRVAVGRDVDGDGVEEILFAGSGALLNDPDPVTVMRQDGSIVETVLTATADGASLASIGDVTGDGRGEWLQAIFSGQSFLSEAHLFSRGLDVTAFSTAGGALSAGFAIDIGPGRGGAMYWQLWSLSGPVPGFLHADPAWPLLPLTFDPATTAAFQSANTPFFPGNLGTLDAFGRAASGVALPAGIVALMPGARLTTAVAVFAPGGWPLACASNPHTLVLP